MEFGGDVRQSPTISLAKIKPDGNGANQVVGGSDGSCRDTFSMVTVDDIDSHMFSILPSKITQYTSESTVDSEQISGFINVLQCGSTNALEDVNEPRNALNPS